MNDWPSVTHLILKNDVVAPQRGRTEHKIPGAFSVAGVRRAGVHPIGRNDKFQNPR